MELYTRTCTIHNSNAVEENFWFGSSPPFFIQFLFYLILLGNEREGERNMVEKIVDVFSRVLSMAWAVYAIFLIMYFLCCNIIWLAPNQLSITHTNHVDDGCRIWMRVVCVCSNVMRDSRYRLRYVCLM